ncbi:MAG: isoprenyl transferase [Candidatus Omnitrophica bacterium]|nr:isoprenyl transferase [Candidatus Omnitrophota bacterium]
MTTPPNSDHSIRLDSTRLPQHLAIIMDGNGRWATARGLPRILGHRAGAEAVRRVVEGCCELGIPALTLYAFSWENWRRPSQEIRELMELLVEFLQGELDRLRANEIRLQAIGRLEELPPPVLHQLQAAMAQTEAFHRMTLTLALSYGGRQELVDATRHIARLVQQGRLTPEVIDEQTIAQHLYRPDLPDPDLLIRTSGEQRLSNFLLWQISYCELYVTPTLWPDFTKQTLVEAVAAYQHRQRRFGNTTVSEATNGQSDPAAE